MLERKKSIVKLYKKNSVFFSIFMILLALSVAMIGFYGYFINVLITKNHKDYINETNFSILMQTDDTVNLAFDFLKQSMTQLLWNDNMVKYMVNPLDEDEDLEYEILQLLANTSDKNKMIQKIWFYSPYSDMIFSSNGTKETSADFGDVTILNEHLLEKEIDWNKVSADMYSDLFYSNQRLFLCQKLVIASTIGIVIFEIDPKAFYSAIGADNGDDLTYIFDADGNLIRGNTTECPFEGEIDFTKEEEFLFSPESVISEKHQYYRVVDEKTRWSFVRVMDKQSLKLKPKELASMLFPSILLFFTIGMFGSYFVTNRIYRPINRLIHLVLKIQNPIEGTASLEDAKNEIDYLELSYSDTLEKNIQLMETMKGIAGDVFEQTFRNLIIGKEVPEDYLIELLDRMGHPIHVNDSYIVLACKKDHFSGISSSFMEANIFFLSIQQLVRGEQVGCRIFCVQIEPDVVGIILCFPMNSSALTIKKKVAELENILRRIIERTAYIIELGKGKIYHNLRDVFYSYKEALDEVNYAFYIKSDMRMSEDHFVGWEDAEWKNYYIERTCQMIDAAVKRDNKEALQLLERTLLELSEVDSPIQILVQYYGQIVDTLMEKLLSFDIEFEPSEKDKLSVKLGECISREDVVECVRTFGRTALSYIETYSNKSRYRYVEEGKLYIRSNFTESGLGVNDVSEYLGINSNYFSELFNEVAKESFTTYLNYVRVEHAKNMLALTRIPIKDIGFKCGFNTVQSFNRVFKKIVQLTPTQYRERIVRK